MQSDYINYIYSKYRITFEHTCKYRHQSHSECGCCYQWAATAMWGTLNLVILLCIYSTSCSWQWAQKSLASSVPSASTSFQLYRVVSLSTNLYLLLSQVDEEQRTAAVRSEGWRMWQQWWWAKCAESSTGCPKSLQVRDPKCFTMVYSKQLIKEILKLFLFTVLLLSGLSCWLWIRRQTHLVPASGWEQPLLWCLKYFGSLWSSDAKSSVYDLISGVGPVELWQAFHPSNQID